MIEEFSSPDFQTERERDLAMELVMAIAPTAEIEDCTESADIIGLTVEQ